MKNLLTAAILAAAVPNVLASEWSIDAETMITDISQTGLRAARAASIKPGVPCSSPCSPASSGQQITMDTDLLRNAFQSAYVPPQEKFCGDWLWVGYANEYETGWYSPNGFAGANGPSVAKIRLIESFAGAEVFSFQIGQETSQLTIDGGVSYSQHSWKCRLAGTEGDFMVCRTQGYRAATGSYFQYAGYKRIAQP